MKKTMLILLGLISWSCAQDPVNHVREMRRKYDLSIDLTAGQDQVASYEIKVQNNAGDNALQELTVRILLLDGDKNELWSVQKELDVSGLGHYASKSFIFKDPVGDVGDQFEMYDVVLASDDENSNYLNYKEFKRIAP